MKIILLLIMFFLNITLALQSSTLNMNRFSGVTSLANKEFKELHVDGIATLKKVQANKAHIFGSCTLDFCTFGERLKIDGTGTLHHTSVEGQFIGNGGITMQHGTLGAVSINGDATIKDTIIEGNLLNNGGCNLNDVQVNGVSTIHGNLHAYDTALQSLIVQGQSVLLKRCKVHGPIMMKKFYSEEKTGWIWLRGFFSWVKKLLGWQKKHRLELINTKVYGDITFEIDEHVESRVVYISGSTQINGSIVGAKVVKR